MMLIEVFKTNVEEREQAKRIIDAIHSNFENHQANFDLQDCDRILRVVSANGTMQIASLINLVRELGHEAEVLSDY